MDTSGDIFKRTELLLGSEVMEKITHTRVIIFGVGGVGSWCAESLVRSGIKHLTIVDSDSVCATNINRQLMATTRTVGQAKVDVLKTRLLEINPNAQIVALQKIYSEDSAASFELDTYHYIIDAIDSLRNKIHLIQTATRTPAVFFSSMGAALKMDSQKIRVDEFWKVKGCPLGAALRRRLRKAEKPAKKFLCVYSEEVLENKGKDSFTESPNPDNALHDWNATKAQTNGTVAHITAIFGFTLAGLVMQDICKS
ncbi:MULTISPECIES: tRNA threonylcarbamoyladenosine dehydratase [unclassified Dysgonomonas]|uniref:tRNA threonylcarbamoyladenosine dehydratase n=1 Tax=unclassified Dysgonomonas TaxID=2630389 RepID=UPI002474F927|nr:MULTISPECIES: tRNA threonylcarbamoyladenosine dehydratase [unclassified Dysgonomonas]